MVSVTTEPATRDFGFSISDVIIDVLSHEDSSSYLDPSHEVLITARMLIDEALGVHAHWDTTSPIAARTIVKGHMRRLHHELSEEALEALAVYCTRDFRGAGL